MKLHQWRKARARVMLARGKLIFCFFMIAMVMGLPGLAGQGGEDWVQWRGGDMDGMATSGLDLSTKPALGFEIVYQKPLGSGYSSISIKDNVAVTMATQDGGDYVIAFAANSGRVLWRYRLEDFFPGGNGADDGPSSTPTIDRDRVYALSARGLLVAIALQTGDLLWQCDLPATFGSQVGGYGYTTAPLLFEDKVLIAAGGTEKRSLAALSRKTGKTIWTAGVEGRVLYHNPILVDLLGQKQCLVPMLNHVISVDPKSGELLWQYKTLDRVSDSQIVAIDSTHFATASQTNAKLFLVAGTPEAYEVSRVWKSLAFKNTHGTPVRVGNHLYGFNGYFLTCVDIETGKAIWKSRPPGGQNLIAVDQTLLFWDRSGSLAAVEATSEGYREKGRIKLSQQTRVYSPPSFAQGSIFLRDLKYLYKVAPKALSNSEDSQKKIAEPVGLMAELHGALSKGNSEQVIQDFLGKHSTWPIRDKGWVHFLFRGDVTDLAIVGDMTGGILQEPMWPIQGTNLFYRTYPMEAGHRWEYQFAEFENKFVDPHNPNKVATPNGEKSVFQDRGWRGFQSATNTNQTRGEIIPLTLPDPESEEPVEIKVYLPAGHQPHGRALPFLIVARGQEALEYGHFDQVLDDRMARGKPPVALVFLLLPQSAWYSSRAPNTFRKLNTLILPELEKRFQFSQKREDRGWLAQDWSATIVLRYLLGENPDFGMLAVQSLSNGIYFKRNFLDPNIAKLPSTRMVFEWGKYDQVNPNNMLDVAKTSQAMVRYFQQKGHQAIAKPGPGGHGWIAWQARLNSLLDALFPAANP